MANYVIACSTPWFWQAWERQTTPPGDWVEVRNSPLMAGLLERLEPRYVFFPHWSEILPPEIVERWECVCFHATPVPYGRGGSPVQNMIVNGHSETELTALRMVSEVDAGPIYMREPLSLFGGGDEVFIRIGKAIAGMIPRLVAAEPEPSPQEGETVAFARRTPADSALPAGGTLEDLFDFIRMLDAEGYPAAFVDLGPWRIELSRPTLRLGKIEVDAKITLKDAEPG